MAEIEGIYCAVRAGSINKRDLVSSIKNQKFSDQKYFLKSRYIKKNIYIYRNSILKIPGREITLFFDGVSLMPRINEYNYNPPSPLTSGPRFETRVTNTRHKC